MWAVEMTISCGTFYCRKKKVITKCYQHGKETMLCYVTVTWWHCLSWPVPFPSRQIWRVYRVTQEHWHSFPPLFFFFTIVHTEFTCNLGTVRCIRLNLQQHCILFKLYSVSSNSVLFWQMAPFTNQLSTKEGVKTNCWHSVIHRLSYPRNG